MKLPKDIQHFPEPTLIVQTDEQEAKFWLAGGDALEELDSLSLAREKLSDREGAFHTRMGYQHVGSDLSDRHDTPRKEKFTKKIGETIKKIMSDGHATKIHLVAPPEMLHRIQKHLGVESKKMVVKTLDKDLMKFGIVEIIERLFEKPTE